MSTIAAPARPQATAVTETSPRRTFDARMLAAMGFIVVLVVVSHGYNMLHFPYLEDDEGTYFSQAWAVFHLGRLASYTYIYDHAPLGWIQIAMWQFVTLGYSFGYALASGRMLMLLFQLGSALLVFAIARRASGKVWVGLLAGVVFSLSSYGIFYHRRILLDNVATFWLLLSIYFLVGRVTLRRVWLSAIAIGVAVLSKEVAIAAIPALAVLVARQTSRSNRLFAVTGWLALSLSICSTYLLLALLKGELFPAGTALGGDHPHVSLLCSLQWQASRAPDGGIFDPSSKFWLAASSWAHTEPLLVIGGTGAALLSIVALRRERFIAMLGWTVLSLWLFLGRGGMVLDFYLVPLLPLLALSLALVLDKGIAGLRPTLPSRLVRAGTGGGVAVAVVGCALLLLLGYQRSGKLLWTANPVAGQLQAVKWIDRHVTPNSRMVIDQYMWSSLHTQEPRFPDAQYYWKVGEDPEVQREGFGDDWRKVDYVVTTPQLVSDTRAQGFPIVLPALEHSVLVAAFNTGWPVEVRRVAPHARSQYQLPRVNTQQLPSCMTYTGA
jgi:4-amino-4-deoxy-L-arabinose transferase-like glycosyltransferase